MRHGWSLDDEEEEEGRRIPNLTREALMTMTMMVLILAMPMPDPHHGCSSGSYDVATVPRR